MISGSSFSIEAEADPALLLRARVVAAFYEECLARRPYWIGGIPTPLDLMAARKAVARRLRISEEAVLAALPCPEEEA